MAIFLITDGYSNGGDPRPLAAQLRRRGVRIFTIGIRHGNQEELREMATDPFHCYILDDFEEFEALARRALHQGESNIFSFFFLLFTLRANMRKWALRSERKRKKNSQVQCVSNNLLPYLYLVAVNLERNRLLMQQTGYWAVFLWWEKSVQSGDCALILPLLSVYSQQGVTWISNWISSPVWWRILPSLTEIFSFDFRSWHKCRILQLEWHVILVRRLFQSTVYRDFCSCNIEESLVAWSGSSIWCPEQCLEMVDYVDFVSPNFCVSAVCEQLARKSTNRSHMTPGYSTKHRLVKRPPSENSEDYLVNFLTSARGSLRVIWTLRNHRLLTGVNLARLTNLQGVASKLYFPKGFLMNCPELHWMKAICILLYIGNGSSTWLLPVCRSFVELHSLDLKSLAKLYRDWSSFSELQFWDCQTEVLDED